MDYKAKTSEYYTPPKLSTGYKSRSMIRGPSPVKERDIRLGLELSSYIALIPI